MLGTRDWAGKGMLGDEREDLRLDLSGFNTPDGDLVRGGEWRGGKGTAVGVGDEEPSSSSKWKVGRLVEVRRGRAPRDANAPPCWGNIVGCKNQKNTDHM